MKSQLIVVLAVLGLPFGACAEDEGNPVQAEPVEAQAVSSPDTAGQEDGKSSGKAAEIWEKTTETSERAWEATRDAASGAAGYTYEKAGDAWEATREGTGKAIEWSREKSNRAWEATREGTGKAVDWTTEKSGQTWEVTKDAAGKTGDAVKRGYESAKEKTREMVDNDE